MQLSTRQPTATASPALNLLTSGPTAADLAHDLVSRAAGVAGPAPVVPGLMQVRVAHAAVEDLDLHVVGPERPRSKWKGASGVLASLAA
jgi:hypothetical protein